VGALGLDAEPVFLDSVLERQEWHVLEAESMKVSCTIPEHPLQRVRMTVYYAARDPTSRRAP